MGGSGRYRRKTWTERMNSGRSPMWRIQDTPVEGVPAGARLLVSTPVMVDAAIRNIPWGMFAGPAEIRRLVAEEYGAEYVCPVTFGMNLRIVAESAYEQFRQGVPAANVTPVWRVIHPSAPLSRRCTFPESFLTDRRREEGLDD